MWYLVMSLKRLYTTHIKSPYVKTMYPCSTKTREVLGNPSPPPNFPRPKRFPEGEARGKSRGSREIREIFRGRGFAPRDPRDFPRAKPEGNPEGRGVQNPRPRKISRAEGMDFPIPPESWWSTDILSSLPGKDWLTTSYFILHTSYCALISPSSGSFLIQAGTLTMLLYKWYCVLFQNSTFMI